MLKKFHLLFSSLPIKKETRFFFQKTRLNHENKGMNCNIDKIKSEMFNILPGVK